MEGPIVKQLAGPGSVVVRISADGRLPGGSGNIGAPSGDRIQE